MKVYLYSIDDLQFEKVAYYTVQLEARGVKEFDDFLARMSLNEKDRSQLQEINRLIERIGKLYGAEERYFKREGYAERLPPPTYRFVESDGETDFGLRLYCIRISEEIVILLNGDRKTAQSIKDCPQCFPHFEMANHLSDAIYDARQKNDIEVDGFDLLTEEDFVLYI